RWGRDSERMRSERIAAQFANAHVPDRQPLDATARIIAGASLVVGVDTGLLHLAAALGVPLVAIFLGSEPGLTGPMGAGPIEVIGRKRSGPAGGAPARARRPPAPPRRPKNHTPPRLPPPAPPPPP